MAEQDKYASYFGSSPNNPTNRKVKIGIPDLSGRLGAEQERWEGHFALPSSILSGNIVNSSTNVGILQSTILPSLGFQSGLAITAYIASRATNRVEVKDWLWPSGQVLNAWWSALGSRVVYNNLTVRAAWSTLCYPEKLLLAGVTAWGGRLFYRIVSRSLKRGKDDERYEAVKKEEGFWDKTAVLGFLSEALIQTIITLPFTLPFRDQHASALACPPLYHPDYWHTVSVGLFSAGMALEVLADTQLAQKQENGKSKGLQTEGVWSIVRHPNYLGDALVHASFPLLLYSTGIMHPITLLGPIANYVFLRYLGGDRETEASQEQRYKKSDRTKYVQLQEYKETKNSFWPRVDELGNPWCWVVVGAGFGGALVEYGAKYWL